MKAPSTTPQNARQQALLERLEQRRITPEKEIPPMHFLYQMFGKPCFPRGELVAITGKAKAGKTFVSSILMALCFKQEVLTLRRLEDEQLSVLWFDTEQSEESTQDILCHRILPMISPSESHVEGDELNAQLPENFHIFNVRADFWQERLPLLEAAINHFNPDLVILDGIRDLVSDINDGVMAQDVIERLMHLASEHKCCLTCVLHQNKGTEDKNLRGWIGTELKNKAFEVYECTKDADRIFTLQQTDTRKYDIVDKLKYTVDEDGIPQLCSVEQFLQNPSATGPKPPTPDSRPALNPLYVKGYDGKYAQLDIQSLFTDAFRPGEQKSAASLQATVMTMANITSYKFYNRHRAKAMAQGIIVQTQDPEGHTAYLCPGKPEIVDTSDHQPQQLDLFPDSGNGGQDELPF